MNWILGLLLGLLIIDGFPAGADLLREFGSRPDNILLAAVGAFILVKRWLEQRDVLAVPHATFNRLLLLFLVVPLINVPIAIYCSPTSVDEVIGTWFKQYAMLVWACLSFYVWRDLLKSRSSYNVALTAVVASAPALAMFYVELIAPDSPLMLAADVMRFKEDARPSGFATEPSVYASWTLVIWPLALLVTNSSPTAWIRWFARLFLLAMFASIYLCNARTAAGIGILQVLFYMSWAFRRGRIGVGTASGIVVTLAALPLVLIKLATVADLQSNLSNIARIGSTVAGVLITADYPLFGVGIGQFKYFLASYAPAFATVSDEISAWGDGSATFRASTFNLFVRLLCEFGVIAGGIACWLLARPLVRSFTRSRTLGQACVTLSAIGGFGFWLMQDQYAYQPGIFAFALLVIATERGEAVTA
ncbi:MAG: hypothetical protein JWQ90_2943 [Hydrocarboniphaga sp.]|uniref:O-antigen ligase family protein n=1 Tax=Hydrocarboniphaga sp. TaxID=2033016 RepID=UPI00261E7C16|nr:hypothetical protein [Hydrocarboniphaga sp.]MDB5970493.1 hypothetical protein [Hydrocarboniphaga sp.]